MSSDTIVSHEHDPERKPRMFNKQILNPTPLATVLIDITANIAAMRFIGQLKIVPGFSDIRVHGIKIGQWETARQLFGDDDDRIAAASFTLDLTIMYRLFCDPADQSRFENRIVRQTYRIQPELIIEDAIVAARRSLGQIVVQQVKCNGGIIDIIDHTARQIIECKASSKRSDVFSAVEQLHRYASSFPGYSLVIGLPTDIKPDWINIALRAIDVQVVTPDNPIDEQSMIIANRVSNRIIALTDADQFADWIMASADLDELPKIIAWVEGVKPKDLTAALRRVKSSTN